MTIATAQPMTLEEYLALDRGEAGKRYELVNGFLVDMGAESHANVLIASFLFSVLLEFVPFKLLCRGTEIEVVGSRANTRFPDFVVLTEACSAALSGQKRSLITLDMPAPALVIEAVSNSETDKQSRDRDYVLKRKEYAQRGIPEYWIVNPVEAEILILNLVDGQYQEQRFAGNEPLVSAVFPDLKLTADRLLQLS